MNHLHVTFPRDSYGRTAEDFVVVCHEVPDAPLHDFQDGLTLEIVGQPNEAMKSAPGTEPFPTRAEIEALLSNFETHVDFSEPVRSSRLGSLANAARNRAKARTAALAAIPGRRRQRFHDGRK